MGAPTSTDYPALPDALRASARRFPGHTAILHQGRRTTFAQLDAMSDRIASALVGLDIRRGDRVGLYLVNSEAFPAAYFGILKAGATVVPLNLLLNPREIIYILNDAGARGLIYFDAFAESVTAVRREVPSLSAMICVGERASNAADVRWADALASRAVAPGIHWNPAEDIAALIYTSGTTGKPKGAMLTHANLVANTRSVQQALKLVAGEDTVLVVLPMFHAFAATAGMLTPLLCGCTIVPLPRFDPELVAHTIAESGATLFMGVPSMFSSLLRLPEAATVKLQSLKYCASGGAAMPAELMRQFEERFGKLIYEGDGPTECSPVTCCNPVGGRRKLGSVGPAVADVEMSIRDDQGGELPRGGIGEICVRGPNVMKGYWNRPEDTREAFFGEWFRTGDLGYEDEDHYFFIVDRKKDMIIVNGMNVYPRVVEEILYQFEPVREAAVVGEPDDLHGEIPVAFVVLKEGQRADAAEIRAFCRRHLGRHEVPRKVHFRAELPKNATGKILKRELRQSGELERGAGRGLT